MIVLHHLPLKAQEQYMEPTALEIVQSMVAASHYREWEHLRGSNGWWIEMDSRATVKDITGKKRRAIITKLTPNGPEVTYQDDGSVEIVPLKEVKRRVTPARQSVATLRSKVNKTPEKAPARGGNPRVGYGDVELDHDFVNWLLLQGENGNTTARRWLQQNPDGTWGWNPERQALHDEIVKKALLKVTPRQSGRRFNMLGGGPASGKSEIRKLGVVPGIDDSVLVDSDLIKDQLPEYTVLVDRKDAAAAAIAHGESSYLATRIHQAALERGMSVTLDGTGDGKIDSLVKKINEAREAGYEVHGYYATVPVEVAIARNEVRRKETGRAVPEAVVKSTHARVSSILPKVYDNFDSVELYDSTTRSVVKVMEFNRDEGLVIHDSNLWDSFVVKGNEVKDERGN